MIRKTLLTCFKILVSVFLIWFLLRQIGVGRVWGAISKARPAWLCGGMLLFAATHFLGGEQWNMLLKAEGISIPRVRCLSIYFVGLFFNNFLIGGVGGDLFRMLDVRRISKQGSSAVSAVFLDRLMGLLVMTTISVVSIPFALTHRRFGPFLWISFAVLAAGWSFSLFFFFHKPFARSVSRFIQILIPGRIEAKAREVYQKIHGFGRNRALCLRVLGFSAVIQTGRIYTHYLLARALGTSISPAYFFLVIPIVAMAASLPVSFGGIGLREQTGVVLLGAAGMTPAQAVSVEFLAYLAAIVTSLPGGVLFILSRRRQGR
jgi:glycosyltransferase 2 family protein